MMIALGELVLLLLALGLLLAVAWGAWPALRALAGDRGGPAALPARQREVLAEAIERARWAPAHDEVGGVTRVLVRRAFVGLDGRPEVLDERVLETFPANDPAWEARFTEAMSRARYRCAYLNAEESP
ncbi:MAG: hypothetical protein ABWY29_01315 [Blastococcus sp.]